MLKTKRMTIPALLLTAVLAVCLSLTVFAEQEPVEYYVCDGNGTNWRTETVSSYTVVDSSTIDSLDDDDWEDGWYVVQGEVSCGKKLTMDGDVRLILTAGSAFTTEHQIVIEESLTVYGQEEGTPGKLTVDCTKIDGDDSHTAIADGGDVFEDQTFTVYGGEIEANGSNRGAGIGGNPAEDNDLIVTIYGGKVTARSSGQGAGIGGGGVGDISDGAGGTVIIYGGEVEASSAKDGAGIGGGNFGDGGEVTIYGGKVTARSYGAGAGIGGGIGEECGKVVINGGEVFAESCGSSDASGVTGGGAGIGAGADGDGDDDVIIINGGKVTAYSHRNGAGIGGGCGSEDILGVNSNGDCGKITINGGEVIAASLEGGSIWARWGDGAGIGGGAYGNGGEVTINGGKVTAYSTGSGAGIGGGEDADSGTFRMTGGSLHAYNEMGYACAVGHGSDGGKNEDDYIAVTGSYYDNIGGKFLTRGFESYTSFGSDGWERLFREREVNISSITGEEFPVSYQKITERGPVIDTCGDYQFIYPQTNEWKSGWYLVCGTGTIFSPVAVSGDVHLILTNDCSVNVCGIQIRDGGSLTIYREQEKTGEEVGRLTSDGGTPIAIIMNPSNIGIEGKTVIHGGSVSAKGVLDGPGFRGELTVYGGSLSAEAKDAPGIDGDLTVYGGSVTGNGGAGAAGISGDTTLYGGSVTGNGGAGAAGISGDTTLYGGTVTANGGSGAVGFGGGNLFIYSGRVNAVAGEGGFHGIGPANDYPEIRCPITVGNGTALLNSTTGKPVPQLYPTWNENLNAEEISVIAVYEYYSYVSGDGTFETLTCRDYRNAFPEDLKLTDGFYVPNFSSVITVEDPVEVEGNVSLVLRDDFTLNLNGGVRIADGGSLTVYVQSMGSHAGQLNVTSPDGAAISGGSLILKGGKLTAVGADGFRGIDSTVVLGDHVALKDGTTGEFIDRPDGSDWNDVLDGSSVSVTASPFVDYIEYCDNGTSSEEKICRTYQLIDSSTKKLVGGVWYVAEERVTIDSALTVSGDVHLILANGCRLTVNGGIFVETGNSLTIYAASEGSRTGKLLAYGDDQCAGIGGSKFYPENGPIVIHGGNITAVGGNYTGSDGQLHVGGGAGIGSGEAGDQIGAVIVYGGTVTAQGGTFSAGIGSGYKGENGGYVLICGGTVRAIGGGNNESIYGSGAGIGSGADAFLGCSVTVNGGRVEAVGGCEAAGIGGGYKAAAGELYINGGSVEATGGPDAAGVGSGFNDNVIDPYDYGGMLEINGGSLTARSGGSSNVKSALGISCSTKVRDDDIVVGEGITLIDNVTGERIDLPRSGKWIDVLCGSKDSEGNYVISVTVKTGPVAYTGASLTLGSEVDANFFVVLEEGLVPSVGNLHFSVGGTETEGIIEETEDGRIVFSCPVNALQMAETIKVTYTIDGVDYEKEYSICQYIESLVAGSYPEEAKTAAKKLANYGYYAQKYLSALHSLTLGEGGYTEMTLVYDGETDALDVDEVKKNVSDDKIVNVGADGPTLYGRSLTLNGAVALNFYIKVGEGSGIRSATLAGSDEQLPVRLYKEGIYAVTVKDIPASELGKPVTVIVTTADGSSSFTSSALGYCASVINKENTSEDSERAMAAICEYCFSALAYRESLKTN